MNIINISYKDEAPHPDRSIDYEKGFCEICFFAPNLASQKAYDPSEDFTSDRKLFEQNPLSNNDEQVKPPSELF